MAEGPFGGPRVLDVGPFSSDEYEVETSEVRKQKHSVPRDFENIIEEEGIEYNSVTEVIKSISVKQSPEETGLGIIDSISEEVAELGERVAHITYYILDSGVGYISYVEVDKQLRRKGIGSHLRSEAISDMEDEGVEVVYSIPISSAGVMLAESQGFEKAKSGSYYKKEI